jgi:hypothetical protein
MFGLLCEATPAIEQITQLGAAGLMGAMWLWERRTSRQREQQLDEAHTRIISDRIMLGELIDVVKQNTETLSKLSAAWEHRTQNESN